jgi:predicted patatin/cPLA2 family phospholipase
MSEAPTPRLAIVCAGGGTSCSYSGGALVALAKAHGLLRPDFMIAASGAAGSAMYYLTGQYDSIERIWTRHICSSRFLSFGRFRKMMDVDYLIDTIIRKLEPIDLDTLSRLPTRYFIPVKNALTGKGRYLSCRDGHDVHEVLRATKALPFFYARRVHIDGEAYIDSAFTITKEHGIAKALSLGATHVLVLEIHSRKKTRLRSLIGKCLAPLNRDTPSQEVQGVCIFRLGPDQNPAPPVTRNPRLLSAAFHKGYEDVLHNKELEVFLRPFV